MHIVSWGFRRQAFTQPNCQPSNQQAHTPIHIQQPALPPGRRLPARKQDLRAGCKTQPCCIVLHSAQLFAVATPYCTASCSGSTLLLKVVVKQNSHHTISKSVYAVFWCGCYSACIGGSSMCCVLYALHMALGRCNEQPHTWYLAQSCAWAWRPLGRVWLQAAQGLSALPVATR